MYLRIYGMWSSHFNRENLQKTISILEEKLKNINKESELKIYLTPEESKNSILSNFKAEYDHGLENKYERNEE